MWKGFGLLGLWIWSHSLWGPAWVDLSQNKWVINEVWPSNVPQLSSMIGVVGKCFSLDKLIIDSTPWTPKIKRRGTWFFVFSDHPQIAAGWGGSIWFHRGAYSQMPYGALIQQGRAEKHRRLCSRCAETRMFHKRSLQRKPSRCPWPCPVVTVKGVTPVKVHAFSCWWPTRWPFESPFWATIAIDVKSHEHLHNLWPREPTFGIFPKKNWKVWTKCYIKIFSSALCYC